MPNTYASMAALPAHPGERVFNGLAEWQAGLGPLQLPLACQPADPQAFFKNAAVITELCGNPIAELRGDPQRLTHGVAEIGAASPALALVQWQLAGRIRIRQGQHAAMLEPGSWALLDGAAEFTLDVESGSRWLMFVLPQTQAAGWRHALGHIAAAALPERGSAHIARSILQSVLRAGAEVDERGARALRDSVVGLIEHALKLELEGRGLTLPARRPVEFAQIESYVLEHLADNALSVERVASVFGISRRSLYNLCTSAGITPHTLIQRARLDRARTLLSDPVRHHLPIVRIAEQCGFSDAAHFSRAFHARHGAAPNAWRSKPH